MKAKTKLRIFNCAAFCLGCVSFFVLWWASGEPFPTRRGLKLVLLLAELPFFGFIGVALFNLAFLDWTVKTKMESREE